MKQKNFLKQSAVTTCALNENRQEKPTRLSGKMALLSGVVIMCMQLLGSKANAQIATYTGTGGTSTAITYVANETGSVLQKTGFGTATPCGSGGLSGMTNNGVTTYAATNAHAFFKIAPNTSFQLNVTSLSVKLRRSGSGLAKVRFAYSLDNGATWTDDGVDHAPDNSSCGAGSTVFTWGGGTLPVGITSTTNGIIFGFYAYAPIAAGGVFQINSIIVGGSVVAAGSCTGTPAAGTAAGSPASLCGSGASVLSLSGATAGTGISYQWQSSSASSGPFTDISGETNLTYNASVSTTTYYRCVTTCASFGAANSSVASVTVNPLPASITGTTTIPQHTTSTLSDVDAGGTWSSSDASTASVNATTGDVYGVASGSATITYTLPTGCATTTAVTISNIPFNTCARNLVVLTANGTSSAAASVTLREYDNFTLNQATPISTDGIPATGAGQLTISGSASTEGHLALDAEWTHLVFAGYDAAPGTANVATAAGINRKIYSVDASATNTLVANDGQTTTFKTSNIRSAAANGTDYYSSGNSSTAGTAGIQLNGATTSTQITATTINTRVVGIFNGQLYYTSASAAGMGLPFGLYKVGTGIPTSITASTNEITTDTNSSPLGFSVSPDGNTAYIADDRSTAGKGIYKYTRSGATWSFAYKLANGAGARSVVVDYSTVPYATVYATTASNASTTRDTLIKIVDSNATAPYVNLATSDSGTSFRGVSFAPGCCAKIYAITSDVICNGDSATVVIYGNPGATVYYSDGSSTFTVTLNASGTDTIRTGALTSTLTYSLVAITTSTCDSVALTGSATITVNQAPEVDDISADFGTSVCVGSTLVLGDAFPGGVWSSSDNAIATVDAATGVVTGVSAGAVTISYTVTNSCGATTVTIGITVDAPLSVAAISGPSSVAVGSTITLTDATAAGTWSSSDVLVATVDAVSGDVTGVSTGLATITYTVTNSCGSVFVTYDVQVTGLLKGIAPNSSVANTTSNISLYPNPANTTLNINATEKVNVTILSVDGKVLMEQKDATTINVSNLATGVYMIKIYNTENVLIKNTRFTKN